MNSNTTETVLDFFRTNFPEKQLQSPGDINDFFDESGITITSVRDDLEDVEHWVNDDIDDGVQDGDFSRLGISLVNLATALKNTIDSIKSDDEIFEVVESFVNECTPFMRVDVQPLLRSVFFSLFMSPGDAHLDISDDGESDFSEESSGSEDGESDYSEESSDSTVRMQTGSGARKVAYPLALGMIVVALSFLQG